MLNTDATAPVISLKILLEPGLAGSIIGKGGTAITGLTEISGARIKISGINDCYPGTTDQVLLISGGEDQVDSAQELVWHRMAQHILWKGRGSIGPDTFDPHATLDSIRRGDITRGQSVVGRILIPLEACGAVIGTNGTYIKSMSDETGVRIQLSAKDDAVSMATQERIVTLQGEVEDCIQCTANIIKKMQEDAGALYSNKTPSYAFYHNNPSLSAGGDFPPRNNNRSASTTLASSSSDTYNSSSYMPRLPPGLAVVSAVTTLTLTVPDAYAGQIIGKKGSVISEMQARSGASITVSARDSSDDVSESYQGKRTILVVGNPDEAQAALKLVAQKLWASAVDGNGNITKTPTFKRSSPPKGGHSKIA